MGQLTYRLVLNDGYPYGTLRSVRIFWPGDELELEGPAGSGRTHSYRILDVRGDVLVIAPDRARAIQLAEAPSQD